MSGKLRVHPLAPVVALDIDGTLGDYHRHFHWFAELYLQERLEIDWSNTDEFSEALGLEKDVYRDIKLAYRQGGMKRSIPLMDGQTRGIADRIRSELGVQVWICTTRPWQRLDNIDPDTQFWINRNIGAVDGVIYGEDKYLDLADIVGKKRILGVIDDLPENVTAAQRLGLPASIRVGPHNDWFRRQKLFEVSSVHSGEGIFNLTKHWAAGYNSALWNIKE